MNTTINTMSVILFVVLLATPCVRAADDLTTYRETGNDRVSRYLVNLGREFGNTSRSQTATDGVFDFPKYKGNSAHWWTMNDGITGGANGQGVTFYHNDPGPNEEYFGYKFKAPATVESLVLQDYSFGDGGIFTNGQPLVQVLTGSRAGTWTTVAATWAPTYDNVNALNKSTSYTITLDSPAANVWGVRIYGGGLPISADPSGFVACRELQVNGTAHFGQVILTNNLARTPDATPVMSKAQFPADVNRITDGSVARDNSFNTTYEASSPSGATHWVGVMWSTPKNHVGALGWTLRIFGDGGWLVKDTVVVEYADVTDGGSTTNWTAVSGLATLYNDTIDTLVANRAVDNVHMDASYLFTFSEVNGADGLRVRGDGGGTAGGNGFMSAIEVEAFQIVPEPGMLLGLGAAGLALLRRRG